MLKSGIYTITNLITKQVYVGSSQDIKARWIIHKRALVLNKHHSKKLQNVWNKYGEENFAFQVLEVCSINELTEREQYYLDTLNPQYNIRTIADSNRGIPKSENHRNLISEAKKGVKRSQESILKQKETMKGYKKTSEHLEKIRQANLGKKRKSTRTRKVIVENIENQEIQEFDSVKDVAAYFNTTSPFICVKIKEQKLIRSKFTIKHKNQLYV